MPVREQREGTSGGGESASGGPSRALRAVLAKYVPSDRWYMGRGQPGCPWPGGEAVDVTTDDVVAVGVLRMYGDARKLYMVRLHDGREAFVTLRYVSADVARFLRSIGARVPLQLPPRGGWTLTWSER